MVIIEHKERTHLGFHVWSYPVQESSICCLKMAHLGLRACIKGKSTLINNKALVMRTVELAHWARGVRLVA